jgi:hypothetical protein
MHEILQSPMSFWCCMTYMNLKAFTFTGGENETVVYFTVIIFHMISSVSTTLTPQARPLHDSFLTFPPLVFNSPEEETKTHQLTIPNAGGTPPALAMDTGSSSSEQQHHENGTLIILINYR